MATESRVVEPGEAMRRIGQVYRTFGKLVDGPLRKLGFSMGQLPVIVTLKNTGALSQTELARIAQVEQPSMAQLLGRMERDGLVERVPDPADGRSRLVSLTRLAQRQIPQGKSVMDDASELALAGFSSAERQQLLDWLSRIEANLEGALAQEKG